jgi:hypothetical protein
LGTNKTAIAYVAGSINVAFNGQPTSTDVVAPAPLGVTVLTLGGGPYSGSLNGTIKRIAYYPRRLSNTELQGITA